MTNCLSLNLRLVGLSSAVFCVLQPTVGNCQALPQAILTEASLPGNAQKIQYSPIAVYSAAGNGPMKHMIGRVVTDTEASSPERKCIEANPATEKGAWKALVYGPYSLLPAGDYAAFFRIKCLSETAEESVATISATSDFGHNELVSQPLMGLDLKQGTFVQVPLFFHNSSADKQVELPVIWSGNAAIRIDTISLFKISSQGLDLASLVKRVPAPHTSGQPAQLVPVTETRPFPEILPRSVAPADNLEVADLRGLPADEQLAVLCIQGLMNRTQPQIYCITVDQDVFWLDRMLARGWIRGVHKGATLSSLAARYSWSIKGCVIPDPTQPATINLATMMAGLDRLLVCSPALQKRLNLPIKQDLRGRWHTSAEVYRWAFDNLWQRLNHHVIACSYPDQRYLRDYLVANKVFIFWISGPIDGARPYANPQAETELMEHLLAKMPVNIPVLSYPYAGKDIGMGEGPGVTLFAEFGKYLVGTTDTANLTVHSGIRLASFKQRAAPPTPVLDRIKKYVTYIISDGDNIPVLTGYNFPQLWTDPLRGKFPAGWSISPSAAMLVPDVVDYYYSSSGSNDLWIGAVSGIGYTYPDSYGTRYRAPYKDKVFDGFLGQTAQYMDRMDQRILWPMNVTGAASFAKYAAGIPHLQGLFPDYGRHATEYQEAVTSTIRNVPIFSAVTSWKENATDEEAIQGMVDEIKHLSPEHGPGFLHLFVWNWGAKLSNLNEVLKRLGPDYVAVRPDHLVTLCRQYLAQERLIVRAPTSVVALDGQEMDIPVRVQNVSPSSFKVTASEIKGIARNGNPALSTPIAPSAEITLHIKGKPAGEFAEATIRGAGRVIKTRSRMTVLNRAEQIGNIPTASQITYVQTYRATDLSHRAGTAVPDNASISGEVWRSIPGKDAPGYVVYGPYQPLSAGRYLAVFRLKRTGAASIVCDLDTCIGGGNRVTSNKTVTAQDMPDGEYRSIVCVFNHPGGALETRIRWSGECQIDADAVVIFRADPSAAR